MITEFVRKFLVDPSRLQALDQGDYFRQGILGSDPTILVRASAAGGSIHIRGPGRITRWVYNYPIPQADALELLSQCRVVLERRRYEVPYQDRTWKVDQFFGPLEGLWTAEVHLPDPLAYVRIPAWAVRDVTGDARYSTMGLATVALRPGADEEIEPDPVSVPIW